MKRHVAIGNCDFEMEHHRHDNFHWLGLEMVETLLQCLKRTKATEVFIFANIPFSSYDDDEYATICNRITEAMTSIICNASSIDALCNSNHDIKRFDLWNESGSSSDVTNSLALEINQRSDISTNQRLRCKLRSIYFQEDFSLLPFLSMEYAWIPNVLELLTISEKRLPDEDDDEDKEISIDGLTDDETYEEELYREEKTNDNQKMTLPKYIMCHEGDLNGTYHFVRNWNVPYLFDKRL